MAVNLSVPILYPKLKRKDGDVVTNNKNPLAHVKTEFGFDVLELRRDVMLQLVIMTSSALRCQFLCWNKRFRKPTVWI